jgi:hypothetical protein
MVPSELHSTESSSEWSIHKHTFEKRPVTLEPEMFIRRNIRHWLLCTDLYIQITSYFLNMVLIFLPNKPFIVTLFSSGVLYLYLA